MWPYIFDWTYKLISKVLLMSWTQAVFPTEAFGQKNAGLKHAHLLYCSWLCKFGKGRKAVKLSVNIKLYFCPVPILSSFQWRYQTLILDVTSTNLEKSDSSSNTTYSSSLLPSLYTFHSFFPFTISPLFFWTHHSSSVLLLPLSLLLRFVIVRITFTSLIPPPLIFLHSPPTASLLLSLTLLSSSAPLLLLVSHPPLLSHILISSLLLLFL